MPTDQENNLKNRVAVVFGGSYGIGADVAQLLKEKGANVFCYSRSMNGTDVGNKEQVSKALQEVYRQCGRIDYIINTAGLLNKEPLMSCDYQTICNAVNTNYMGTVNVALEAFPYLKESKGKLVFFTSSSYTRGRAFYSIYSSTKAAIVNFVQAIAQEWEPFGISVNCINPERTKTPMRVHNFGIEPDNTLLTSEQVAITTIQSLLSEFTGQVIDVKEKKYEEPIPIGLRCRQPTRLPTEATFHTERGGLHLPETQVKLLGLTEAHCWEPCVMEDSSRDDDIDIGMTLEDMQAFMKVAPPNYPTHCSCKPRKVTLPAKSPSSR